MIQEAVWFIDEVGCQFCIALSWKKNSKSKGLKTMQLSQNFSVVMIANIGPTLSITRTR